MKILFKNARVIGENSITDNCYVATDGDKIAYCGAECAVVDDIVDEIIDVEGKYLSAGFIDSHVHGGNGHDFMDASEDAMHGIADFHSKHGVTSMYAASVAAAAEEINAMLEAYNKYADEVKSCNYLGVHLEGPYFCVAQCGAQNPDYVMAPYREHYTKFLDYGCIKRMSVAPELDGALELGDYLRELGIVASIAHSDADYDQVVTAGKHGYNLMTHLYSGMSGVHRRNAFRYGGVIEAGLLLDNYFVEIIADGCHLPECLLKLIYKCKGRDKIMLVSDAMRGAGYEEGATTVLGSLLKGEDVIIEDGVAKLPDRSAFAGSIASGDRLVRTMIKLAEVPLIDAVYMMTVTPSEVLGLGDNKGKIKAGMDADIIIFDEDINIAHTMVMGNIVFSA